MSIKGQTISGIIWSILQSVGSQFIQFVVTIILARLLLPEDFGLIAMITIFIQISQSLINAGFRQGLIRKKDVSDTDYSTVFAINFVAGLTLYFLCFALAPFIADFYEQPRLTQIIRVLLLIFIFNGLSYIQETILLRDLKFKTLFKVQFPSTVLGGFVGIIMAFQGFGVWSIVGQQLSTRLSYSIQIWLYTSWRPVWVFDKDCAKELFGYGSKLMASGIINTIYQNIYIVAIGKFFPLNLLGYYQNANKFVQFPSSAITNALNVVSFSAFSKMNDDNTRLKLGYKKMIQQLVFLLAPIFTIAAVLAEPIIVFVFTDKWLPSVPYFQMLCIVGVMFPLNVYNKNIIMVKGYSKLFLKITLIEKLVTTLGLILAIPFGINMLILVQVLNSIFAYYLNSFYSGKFINYPIFEQLKDILPTIFITLITGAVVYWVNTKMSGIQDMLRIISCFIFGIGVFTLLSYQFKIAALTDFVGIIKSIIRRKNGNDK